MKTKPNYVKMNDQDQDQAQSINQDLKVYDLDRMDQVREFLFDESDYATLNSHSVLDRYRPPLYNTNDFLFETTEKVKDRFVYWYRSLSFAKILIMFEKSYIKDITNLRRAYENQAFYMDYLTRLKIIYFNAVRLNKIMIRNDQDFYVYYLFLNQIEAYIINGVNQTEPMYKSDLQEKLEKWFYENMNDTCEISNFSDIDKLLIINFAPYYYNTKNNSLVHCNDLSNLYTFELLMFDQDTFNLMYSRFQDLDDLQTFEDQIGEFCENPLYSDGVKFDDIFK